MQAFPVAVLNFQPGKDSEVCLVIRRPSSAQKLANRGDTRQDLCSCYIFYGDPINSEARRSKSRRLPASVATVSATDVVSSEFYTGLLRRSDGDFVRRIPGVLPCIPLPWSVSFRETEENHSYVQQLCSSRDMCVDMK